MKRGERVRPGCPGAGVADQSYFFAGKAVPGNTTHGGEARGYGHAARRSL